jgi:hypothetical protein
MRNDRYRAGKRLWNAEDVALVVARYPHEKTSAVARRLRRSETAVYARARLLGLNKSAEYLASADACRLRRGDNVGKAFRFEKGHVPFNKGLRRPGYAPGRMRETQFKPGTRNGVAVRLYKPIGTERISKDGYLERKVNDGLPLQRRWRAVHVLLWEATNGPVPKGHAIAFRNGDKRDIRLENLECISRRDLMARNTVHNLPETARRDDPTARRAQPAGSGEGALMAKNKIEDLAKPPVRDSRSVERRGETRATAAIAWARSSSIGVIVDTSKVEVDFLKVTGALRSTDFLPSGEEEENTRKPKPKLIGGGGA